MQIKIFNNYHNDENTYLLYENGTGVVIDPGNSDIEITDFAKENNIEIKYILLTHCHYDHIEFLEKLRERTGAVLVCGDKCAENVVNPRMNLSIFGLGYELSPKAPEIILADGEVLNAGSMEIKCVYTPGHTNCSVCYISDEKIFSGDTLFLRNCGRWDLPTGDEATLVKSIRETLYAFDDAMGVYPGHGRETTIGYEKQFNMFVKEK